MDQLTKKIIRFLSLMRNLEPTPPVISVERNIAPVMVSQ